MFEHKQFSPNKLSLSADFYSGRNAGTSEIFLQISEMFFDLGPVSPVGPIGTLPDIDDDTLLVGRPPVQSLSIFDGGWERSAAFSSYLNTAWHFFSGTWNFSRAAGGYAAFGDNPVVHQNIRGSAYSGVNPNVSVSNDLSSGEVPLHTGFVFDTGSGGSFWTTSSRVMLPYTHVRMSEKLNWLSANCYVGGPVDVRGIGGTKPYQSVPCFSPYMTSGDRVAFKMATYTIYHTSAWYHYLEFEHHLFVLEQKRPFGDHEGCPLSDVFDVACYRSSMVYQKVASSRTDFYLWNASALASFNTKPVSLTNPNPWGATFNVRYIGDHLHATSPVGTRPFLAAIGWDSAAATYVRTSDKVNAIRLWEDVVPSLVGDAFPLTALAASDAVDTYTVKTRLNVLESYSDMFGILSLVDVWRLARSLPTLIRRAKNARRDFNLLWRILGWLADKDLLYSFALAPSASDALEVVEKANAYREKWWSFHSTFITLHGKYEMVIPPELSGGYDPLVVTARAKLRTRFASEVLLALLPLRSAGVLPSLSAVWATLPFSFVADWVFPIGDSAEFVESTAILLALETTYSTCSLSFSYELDEAVAFEDYGVQSAAHDEACLQLCTYDRFTLPYVPVVGPSRLLSSKYQPGVPNWLTAGSLLFKQLT